MIGLIAVLFHNFFKVAIFAPLRKIKLQYRPLSFAHVAVLAPKVNFDSVYTDVAP